jgi:hypothetical protein
VASLCLAAAAALGLVGGLAAQSQGPIRPRSTTGEPTAGPITPKSRPGTAEGPLRKEDPPIPVEEIIRQFAAKEAEFRVALGDYTYSQSVLVQEFDDRDKPGGRYERRSEVVFTPEGKRFEKSTYEPPSTLELVSLSKEDAQDLERIQPFVLTTEDLPKYELLYEGRQQVDEIGTYVFRVRPRKLEKGQRYFEGSVWVDDQDLQIVKTYGKAVPDLRSGNGENLFPKFETWRENIDGKYWFPTLTRADDVLRFQRGNIRIKMNVRYANYKRFATSIKIGEGKIIEEKPPKP